jgi:hypothetical protein
MNRRRSPVFCLDANLGSALVLPFQGLGLARLGCEISVDLRLISVSGRREFRAVEKSGCLFL